MNELTIRTEELSNDRISELYVEDKYDSEIMDKLKARSPVLLIGSRGVGKSFLFKISAHQLEKDFREKRVLPVYITFRKAALIKSANMLSFQSWMLGRITSEVIRTLKRYGIRSSNILNLDEMESSIDTIVDKFEKSYRYPAEQVDDKNIPNLDDFIDSVEDLCLELNINRIVLFIDEAAHVFYPNQQREFFTLFRDLRSPYIKCNAAVYPGVTVYGDTFEPVHDAVEIQLVRKITDDEYVENMKQMVIRQVDSGFESKLSKQGEYFTILAYASSGNPRNLLRSVEAAGKFDAKGINNMFREFYREKMWAEHTNLSQKYPGYKMFIDWGRDFIENNVIPALKGINDGYIENSIGKGTSAFFWIHKDVPQEVKEAIRLLEYSGLVYEDSAGIRATRGEIGSRYMVNIGCLLAYEAVPTNNAMNIVKNFDVRRMVEYGRNHRAYEAVQGAIIGNENITIQMLLVKSVTELDLTPYQKGKLHELSIHTIGELLNITEEELMQIPYVAEKRARDIKNACIAAVHEYLLG